MDVRKIVYKKTKSKIKYYTNNAKTKDGLRPGVVILMKFMPTKVMTTSKYLHQH